MREAELGRVSSGLAAARAEAQRLQAAVSKLSYNIASGGGVNLKHMVDPTTGLLTVPLEEVFTFDRNHAACRVDTNRQAFKMETFAMGEVVVEPHQFFMAMNATTVDQFVVSKDADSKQRVIMRGGLSCADAQGGHPLVSLSPECRSQEGVAADGQGPGELLIAGEDRPG